MANPLREQTSSSTSQKTWYDEWLKHENRVQDVNGKVAALRYMDARRGPEINKEEEMVLNYVFAQAPSGVSEKEYEREVLTQNAVISLSRRFMLTLRPGAWIIDDVINSVANIVNCKQRSEHNWRIWCLPTWSQHFAAMDAGRRSRMTSLSPSWLGLGIAKCERIYIPMNEESTHWYLLVILLKEGAVYYVDTLPGNSSKRIDECARVVYWIKEYFLLHETSNPNSTTRYRPCEWKIKIPENVPNQAYLGDGSNCGMYVMHFMTAHDQIPNITPRTVLTPRHRLSMIASLILAKNNTMRFTVEGRARIYCR